MVSTVGYVLFKVIRTFPLLICIIRKELVHNDYIALLEVPT